MATYTELLKKENVSVKVPKKRGAYMNFVPTHEFETDGKTVSVPAHWQHGLLVSGKVIVNRHFFGIDSTDFGHKITAKVEVVRKVTDLGKEYNLENITKISGKSEFALKHPEAENVGNTESPHARIPGSSTIIVFEKIQRKDPS